MSPCNHGTQGLCQIENKWQGFFHHQDFYSWGHGVYRRGSLVREREEWCAQDSMGRQRYWNQTHSSMLKSYDHGSAAYSFEIGNVHFS